MKKNIKYFFCLLTVLFIFSGCTEDNPIIPPAVEDHSPMWPMIGYNARHTGNPNSIRVNMLPVNEGTLYWIDTLASHPRDDGGEASIDAMGNIYHLSTTNESYGVINKFRPDGSIIWSIDTFYSNALCGFALSNDETKFYCQDYEFLYCIDSSGKKLWRMFDAKSATIPIIGRDGTIYDATQEKLTAITPEGNIKWRLASSEGSAVGWPAIDKEDNIYFYSYQNYTDCKITKATKDGNILWEYGNFTHNICSFSVVIDAANNIYFTSTDKLISLNKEGKLRWDKLIYPQCVPAITWDNKIIIDSLGLNIMALDTLGNFLWSTGISNSNYRKAEHSIVLDDNQNIYFLSEGYYEFKAFSLDIAGNIRWICPLPSYWMGTTGPMLSPKGYLFGTPKRPFLVFSVK